MSNEAGVTEVGHDAAPQSREDNLLKGRTFLIEVVSVIAVVELALMYVLWLLPFEFHVVTEALLDATFLAGLCGPLIWWKSVRPIQRRIIEEFARAETAQGALAAELSMRDADGEIDRALDMADSEADVLDVIQASIEANYPDCRGEMLMVDESSHQLRRAMIVNSEPAGCSASSPHECVSLREGQTRIFNSSSAIDACPKLRNREGGPMSAICVPIGILGRSVGVLHITHTEGEPRQETVAHVGRLVSAATGRLGLVRALEASEHQASTDSLTGLANRRTLEDHLRRIASGRSEDQPWSVLMLDLDHFKTLNDTLGHESGDRALQMFSGILREVVRAKDLAARFGGEEFVCVLDGADEAAAVRAADRIQRTLAQCTRESSNGSFTVSIGVATADFGEGVTSVMRRVDGALYEAKRRGRDRVEVADGILSAQDGLADAVDRIARPEA